MVIFGAAISAFAQNGGTSAGGKWMEFDAEDSMTAARKVRFELQGDNFLENSDVKPRVEIFCTNGKFELADFNPATKLAPPNRPSFWGRPQMTVLVRIDDTHRWQHWNWVNGHFLAMDKGTTRGLIGAHIFKVEARLRGGQEIAEFSPGGLDLGRVKKACELTPKKPSNDD